MPENPRPQETPVITAGAVERILRALRRDPESLGDEEKELGDGLRELLVFRSFVADAFLNREDYWKGALFTHRVIRTDLETRGMKPRQLIKGSGIVMEKDFDKRLFPYYTRILSELPGAEIWLFGALRELAGYSNPFGFFAGAIDVYFPLRGTTARS